MFKPGAFIFSTLVYHFGRTVPLMLVLYATLSPHVRQQLKVRDMLWSTACNSQSMQQIHCCTQHLCLYVLLQS
jgi:hypothetical protein